MMQNNGLLRVDDELDNPNPPAEGCGKQDVMVRLEAIGDGKFGSKHFDTVSMAPVNLETNVIGSSGIVIGKGQHVNQFNVGDEVLALLTTFKSTKPVELRPNAVAHISMACHKPATIPFQDAANILVAFVIATRVVRKALSLPITWPQTTLEEHATSPRRFCILGGNTAFGASTVQLLRQLFPQARIVTMIYGATATEEDRQALLQDAFLMLRLGSSYAIDGADSLSLDCLEFDSQKPPEVVISFPHPSELDPEILAHLGGPRVYSMNGDDADFTASMATVDGEAVQYLGQLLKDERHKVAFPIRIDEVNEAS